MTSAERLKHVKAALQHAASDAGRPDDCVTLVAVSKTFPADDIRPVLAAGQRIFGENRVQEAKEKWPALKADYPDTELHLIGPLQSNKTSEAVALFDVIQTVDREKIARTIAEECARQGRTPRLYVQVNTGAEPQKAGVLPKDTEAFVTLCRETYGLTIDGLMCIPPVDDQPALHFALLDKLATACNLPVRSMGMSGDYELATALGATHVRVGSAIFGARDYT